MTEQQERPNILLIMTDQQRWDALGAAGNPVIQTPNLDRLAAEGVIFETAITPSAVCAPARAALMSGYAPSRIHFTSNGDCLADQEDTLPSLLGKAGYRTQALGKMHFPVKDGGNAKPWEATYGFQDLVLSEETRWSRNSSALDDVAFDDYDRYLLDLGLWGWGTSPEIGYNEIKPIIAALPEEQTVTAWLGRRTVEWLRDNQEAPFFLFTSFVKPHAPYDPPEEWSAMYDAQTVPPPVRTDEELGRENPYYGEERRWREWDLYSEKAELQSRAHYYANVSLIDKYVGRILDTLDELNQRDNTVIIFTSDHGDLLGDHWLWFKNVAYDGAARVPLLLAGPGVPQGQRVSESVVCTMDIFATILDLAGMPAQPDRPSRNLLDYLREEEPARSAYVVTEVGKVGQRNRAIRTLNWLYMHWEDGGFEELYDLCQDPNQLHNVSRNPANAATKGRLRAMLTDWLCTWGDPAWEVDEQGDLLSREFKGRRQDRWLPRPHGRSLFHSMVPPALWPDGEDKNLWWWRAVDGDFSRLLDLAGEDETLRGRRSD